MSWNLKLTCMIMFALNVKNNEQKFIFMVFIKGFFMYKIFTCIFFIFVIFSQPTKAGWGDFFNQSVVEICINQAIQPVFLPNLALEGQSSYEDKWNNLGGLSYFQQQIEQIDDKTDSVLIQYADYQQLLRYTKLDVTTPKGTFIVLQGWGGHWNHYQSNYLTKLYRQFNERGYNVLLVDLPGHGFSEASEPYQAISSYGDKDVDALSHLLNHLDLQEPIYAAGHSYGASVATLLSIQNEYVAGSINLSGLSDVKNLYQSIVYGAEALHDPIKIAATKLCGNQPTFIDTLLTRAENTYDFQREESSILEQTRYDDLDKPMLFVGATEDKSVLIKNWKEILNARLNKQQTYGVQFVGCGHHNYLQKQDFASVIDRFLDDIEGIASFSTDESLNTMLCD